MSIRFDSKNNRYCVRLKSGKEFAYSISNYGKYAEQAAKLSDEKGEKIENWYEINDNVVTLYLRNLSIKDINDNNYMIESYVDIDDFELVKNYRWAAYKVKNEFYAQSFKNNERKYMHRVVMNAPDDLVVDHIGGNGLNNVKSNLRLATKEQNTSNRVNAATNNVFNINGLKYANDKKDIQATWMDGNGKRKSKTFRIEKYGGLENTLKIAKDFRDSKLSESSNYIKNEGSFHNDK